MAYSLAIILITLFFVTYIVATCTYEECRSITKTIKISGLVLVASIIFLTVFFYMFSLAHVIML